jgi:hypothetical protein
MLANNKIFTYEMIIINEIEKYENMKLLSFIIFFFSVD